MPAFNVPEMLRAPTSFLIHLLFDTLHCALVKYLNIFFFAGMPLDEVALQIRWLATPIQPQHFSTHHLHGVKFTRYRCPPPNLIFLIARFLELGLVQPFLMSALDTPDPAAINHAVAAALHAAPVRVINRRHAQVQQLQSIGAMDEEQALSPLGYHLAKLPVPPKVSATS